MITGKKVVIRPIEIGDADTIFRWWNDGSMMEHAGFPDGLLVSREAVRINLMRTIENTDPYPDSRRFIICKREDMKPIGEMNYLSWDRRNQNAEFGIKICEMDEQGKGYGEDALRHFINFMFKNLNLHRVHLSSMADNSRAHNLYRKLGFKHTGTEREAYFDPRKGEFVDILLFDILKDEWKGLE